MKRRGYVTKTMLHLNWGRINNIVDIFTVVF